MGSVIKKRRKRMSKKKHRKMLRRTRVQRRKLGKYILLAKGSESPLRWELRAFFVKYRVLGVTGCRWWVHAPH